MRLLLLALSISACSPAPRAAESVRVVIAARLVVVGVPLDRVIGPLRAARGVEEVSTVDWFQADFDGVLATGFAVQPSFFAIPSRLVVERAALDAFAAHADACLVSESLARRQRWRLTQEIAVPELLTGHLREDPMRCRIVGLVRSSDLLDYGQVFARQEAFRARLSPERRGRSDAVVASVAPTEVDAVMASVGRIAEETGEDIQVAADRERTWGRQVPLPHAP